MSSLAFMMMLLMGQQPVAGERPAEAAKRETGPRTYRAKDTLRPQHDAREDARRCVRGLAWRPVAFEVTVSRPASVPYDALVKFPSPVPTSKQPNDTVSMEWYHARSQAGESKPAPAVVVVHESGSRMEVGRLFAKALRLSGCHTFLIHLPYYGERRAGRKRPPVGDMIGAVAQAVADVRRARDAISALPNVQGPFGVQGTSLGGFVAATAASLDRGYDRVFVMLAGGQLFDILQKGKRDAAKIRSELAKSGLSDKQMREVVWRIEPMRVAHRLPRSTWIYSAAQDTIVPLGNARALAQAAKLPADHHIIVFGSHYSCVFFLPHILLHIGSQMRGEAPSSRAP